MASHLTQRQQRGSVPSRVRVQVPGSLPDSPFQPLQDVLLPPNKGSSDLHASTPAQRQGSCLRLCFHRTVLTVPTHFTTHPEYPKSHRKICPVFLLLFLFVFLFPTCWNLFFLPISGVSMHSNDIWDLKSSERNCLIPHICFITNRVRLGNKNKAIYTAEQNHNI